MKVTPEEVLAYDIKFSTGGASCFSLSELEKYSWELVEIELSVLRWKNWNPLEVMTTEGMGLADEPFDSEKLERINSMHWKERSESEATYIEQWGDELYAREYSKLSTEAPAIIVRYQGGAYKIGSGRHRSRSMALKGATTIKAYLGTLNSN